jgi:hypothetical protein
MSPLAWRVSASASATDCTTPRNKQLALALLAVTQFVIVIDASIVNVALPTIGRHLHFSQTDLSFAGGTKIGIPDLSRRALTAVDARGRTSGLPTAYSSQLALQST